MRKPLDWNLFTRQKKSSVISLNTLRRVLRQILSDFWWLPRALDRFYWIFFRKKIWLQMALNPKEFWRAQKSRIAICAYPMPTCWPIFSPIEATFWIASLHSNQKEGGRHVENQAHMTVGPVRILCNEQATCYLIYRLYNRKVLLCS